MYRLLRVFSLIVSVAMLPMHASAMAAVHPTCSGMNSTVLQSPAAAVSADCASMAHQDKGAAVDVDCCSPHLIALPVALAASPIKSRLPQLATCDTRLAERCLSPPERPPRF